MGTRQAEDGVWRCADGGCVLISFTITALNRFLGFFLICDLLDERAPDEEVVLHSVYFILVQKREILERDRVVTCIGGIAGSDYFCLFFLSPLLFCLSLFILVRRKKGDFVSRKIPHLTVSSSNTLLRKRKGNLVSNYY